jgi:predicted DNA-binding protein
MWRSCEAPRSSWGFAFVSDLAVMAVMAWSRADPPQAARAPVLDPLRAWRACFAATAVADPWHAHRNTVFVSGAFWCKMVYRNSMSIAEKTVRQSVSLPARVARRVKSLAKTSSTSANRIIVELIESGIEAREQERKRFFELADRLAHSRDAEDQKRLKEELARMTFGE